MITPEQQRKLAAALDKYRTQVTRTTRENKEGLLIDGKDFIPLVNPTPINENPSIS